jgi:hypothetical protein
LRLGWLAWFFSSLFFPPKDNSILHQQSSRETWKWMGFRHQFRFVCLCQSGFSSFPFVNFIPNFDLVEYFF